MLIKKKFFKRLMDIKKLFILVGAFVLALFSGSVSAVLLGGTLDNNLVQEYHKDFSEALKDCGLDWGDLKQSKYHDYYIDTMHEETNRLAGLKNPPFVEPE